MSAMSDGPSVVDLRDLAPGENHVKAATALARYRVEEVTTEAAFDEGLAPLNAQFAATGEIEREDVLRAWLRAGFRTSPTTPIAARYHMLLVRDADGTLAAVRDCFTATDPTTGRVVVLLSHSLVLPAHRRTGVAALLRACPVSFARADAAALGVTAPKILLFAEMEPIEPHNRTTVTRVLAYARAGFRAIPPTSLPYAQPDFRDLDALGVGPIPLPFLCLIRQIGEDGRSDAPRATIEALVRHVQAIHLHHCAPGQLTTIRDHALGALARDPRDPIPLVRLPVAPSEVSLLAPLMYSRVFALYPPEWIGPLPLGDADFETTLLVANWNPPKEGP